MEKIIQIRQRVDAAQNTLAEVRDWASELWVESGEPYETLRENLLTGLDDGKNFVIRDNEDIVRQNALSRILIAAHLAATMLEENRIFSLPEGFHDEATIARLHTIKDDIMNLLEPDVQARTLVEDLLEIKKNILLADGYILSEDLDFAKGNKRLFRMMEYGIDTVIKGIFYNHGADQGLARPLSTESVKGKHRKTQEAAGNIGDRITKMIGSLEQEMKTITLKAETEEAEVRGEEWRTGGNPADAYSENIDQGSGGGTVSDASHEKDIRTLQYASAYLEEALDIAVAGDQFIDNRVDEYLVSTRSKGGDSPGFLSK